MNPYRYRLAPSASEIEGDRWDSLQQRARHPFMDRRFLQAVETAFASEARFWYATLRDDDDQAVACACYCCYTVDGCVLAPPAGQRLVNAIRRAWPSFFRFRVLLCGSPVSTSGGQVILRDHADPERLALTLDEIAITLAQESRAKFISFKEYDPALAEKLSALQDCGYRRALSVVTHWLVGEYESFDAYYNSRSKRHRANIRRHFRKFDEAGLEYRYYRGRDGVGRLFTEEVHGLYLNVFEKSHAKFERLPVSFFHELAMRLPDESCFMFAYEGERPVGFCCGVAAPGSHTLLYCGLDYSLNSRSDLYFNIIYRGLEQGFAPGVGTVFVGASADEFKQHLGCRQVPLSIYLKAVGPLMSFLFGLAFRWLFPQPPAAAQPCPDTQSAGQPERAAQITAPLPEPDAVHPP